jgi:hypothetical protein
MMATVGKTVGRPRADAPTMPETWKRAVEAAIEASGRTRQNVADELGISPGLLTRMLKPVDQRGLRGSSHAPALGNLVGVPLPGQPGTQQADALYETIRALELEAPLIFRSLSEDATRALQRVRKARRRPR